MIIELSNNLIWKLPNDYVNGIEKTFDNEIMDLPSELPKMKISDHAQEHRVMPIGTPRPGKLDLEYTPHLIEPMDSLSIDSPIQRVVILKGAQQGYTMLAECVLCYYMGYAPADIMFMSSTDDALERWASRRLEPAIDSYGYRKHIYAQETSASSRKKGDKTYSKEYFGCRLDMASYNSPGKMASTDKRVLIRDETDRAPLKVKNEGSPMVISAARVNAWGDRSKILDFSTPTTTEESFIYKEYLKGDQRKRFMPCPKCKKYIELEFEFDYEKKKYGFKPVYEDDEVIDCYYVCQECGYEIKEYEKQYMFSKGEWRSTAKSSSKTLRSYYSPSILAPSDMLSWTKIYNKYLDAKKNPDEGMREFVNIYAGLPYQEQGNRPKIENVHHLRGTYGNMEIPEGVLFLTAAVDVQRGSDKYKDMSPDDLKMEMDQAWKEKKLRSFPRLEMEILGHGSGYRTWSITYIRFEGKLDDIEAGAWEKLTDFYRELAKNSTIIKQGLKVPAIKRKDKYEFDIPFMLIDSKDGEMTETVYSYTQKFDNIHPSMGMTKEADFLKRGDRETSRDKLRYKINKAGQDIYVYNIATNYYKNRVYNRSKIDRVALGNQRPGFMDHSKNHTQNYFKMLFSEERRRDGSFHAGGRRNEALDIKVYNFCAGDIYLDMLVDHFRMLYHKKGYSVEKCKQEINTVWVLQYLEEKTKMLEIE